METFNVHYDKRYNCVIVYFAGDMDLQTLKEYAKEITKIASEHNCKRFFNDLRGAEFDLYIIKIQDIPKIFNELGIDDRTLKRAIVASKDSKEYRFFETVARNSGDMVKVFENPRDAMNWLGGNPTDRAHQYIERSYGS